MNIVADSSDNEAGPPGGSRKWNKKVKKRTGMSKSKSVTLGKEIIRSYSKLFRSTSVEWLSHGKGHRSSISAGGTLEHPELEILPPVFAPLPAIQDQNEDPGLEAIPGDANDAIELRPLHRRRKDHGPSIADGAPTGPSQVDGSMEVTDPVAITEQERRAASPQALMQQRVTAESIISDALSWSRHYESCVYFPRTSRSTSRRIDLVSDSDVTYTTANSSEVPLLIDSMLESPPTSTFPSPLTSPVLSPMQCHAGSPANSFPDRITRPHGKSISSVTSLRDSSMDLLKTLAEAEERERMRCLKMLTRARASSDTRKAPDDGSGTKLNGAGHARKCSDLHQRTFSDRHHVKEPTLVAV